MAAGAALLIACGPAEEPEPGDDGSSTGAGSLAGSGGSSGVGGSAGSGASDCVSAGPGSGGGAAGELIAATWSPALTVIGTRVWAQPIYDSCQQQVIWYGPHETYLDGSNIYSGGIWGYDSTAHAWTSQWDRNPTVSCPGNDPSAGPGNRHPYRQQAYDSKRKRMWVHNGVCQGYNPTLPAPNQGDPDTLYFDSTTHTWTDVTAAATPATGVDRMVSAMVYDSDRDKVILFAGNVSANARYDTWEFDPESLTWTEIETTGIDASSAMAENGMVYDPIHKKVIAFGGWSHSEECEPTGCSWIWEYDPEARIWTKILPSVRPPGNGHPAFAFDRSRGWAWLYAGKDNVWSYDAGTQAWTHQVDILGGPELGTPAPNIFAELAYDEAADKLVLLFHQPTGGLGTYELDLKR